MRIPSDRQVTDALDLLRDRSSRKLRLDLLAALDRERRCGTTEPDGFPPGGERNGSTAPGLGRPVEGAVQARERAIRDRQHACTLEAAEAVIRAAELLAIAEQRMQTIAADRADVPSTPKGCDLCTGAGLPADAHPWEHRGNVGGRLKRDRYLCVPHFDFVRRHGAEPDPEQTRHWDRTGSWKVRA